MNTTKKTSKKTETSTKISANMLFTEMRLLALAGMLLLQLVVARSRPCQNISIEEAADTLRRTCFTRSLRVRRICDVCSLCQNGASCGSQPSVNIDKTWSVERVRSLVAELKCECAPGYTGPHCQIDIDECASSPCKHHTSVCVDQVNGYKCNCVPVYAQHEC